MAIFGGRVTRRWRPISPSRAARRQSLQPYRRGAGRQTLARPLSRCCPFARISLNSATSLDQKHVHSRTTPATISMICCRTAGSSTSRDGLFCRGRMFIMLSNSINSSVPNLSGYRLIPHRSVYRDPRSNKYASPSACISMSITTIFLATSTSALTIVPYILWPSGEARRGLSVSTIFMI